MAAGAPALDVAAGDVARADDDVEPVVERADEVGQVADVVGEVRVHLEEAVVALGEPAGEGLHVRRAEPQLARPVHDAHLRVLRGERVGERAGSVRRVVVDDEHVGFRERAPHGLDEASEVVLLVVSRRDDERARHDQRARKLP